MDLLKEDLPATLQAYELNDNKEIFLAEQVVNNQAEIELFTARYAGKLIKAKTNVASNNRNSYGNTVVKKRNSSTAVVALIIILIIVAVIVYGLYTGWLQDRLNIKM